MPRRERTCARSDTCPRNDRMLRLGPDAPEGSPMTGSELDDLESPIFGPPEPPEPVAAGRFDFVEPAHESFPPILIIAVTNLCDMACIHCAHPVVKKSPGYRGTFMDAEIHSKIVEETRRFRDQLYVFRYAADGESIAASRVPRLRGRDQAGRHRPRGPHHQRHDAQRGEDAPPAGGAHRRDRREPGREHEADLREDPDSREVRRGRPRT